MTRAKASIVGLVPMAGRGQRIAPVPCSKELFPVGFRRDSPSGELRPKAVCHHLFEKFRRAGVMRAYAIIRTGKWDIPAYFVDGQMLDMNLAYLVITHSLGPPDTLDRAYPFVHQDLVAFGFPDIQFGPDDVFERLANSLRETAADIVLGLYPALDVRTMDMVEIDGEGRVRSLVLKPLETHLRYTWTCAVWTPAFTEFMHAFVASERSRPASSETYRGIDRWDLPVGAVIKAAIECGMRAYGVPFDCESYLDVGTPDHLVEAVRRSAAIL